MNRSDTMQMRHLLFMMIESEGLESMLMDIVLLQ